MFLEDIASVLVNAGVGVLGVDIFLSSKAIIPPGNGPYITIIETGGGQGDRVQNKAGLSTARPMAQILTRGKDYTVTRNKCRDSHVALDGLWNTTINGIRYVKVIARQEPTDAGVDEAGRAVIVFNIDCEKQPS